jgi:hypothetical protein
MNIRWPKVRVSRVHRATVVRTDRHMLCAAGRQVDVFMLDEHGSWVRVVSTGTHRSIRAHLTARDWVKGVLGTALVTAAIYTIGFFICAVGPDRW